MRILLLSAILLSSFISLASLAASGQTLMEGGPAFEALNWDEIRPSAIQTESLMADEPKGRAIVNSKTNDLWIAGKLHLWKWSLSDGGVSRVLLPKERVKALHLLYASDQFIYGMDATGAWAFDLSKKTWGRLDGRFKAPCSPRLALPFKQGGGRSLYFLTECGIYVLFFDSKQLVAAVEGSVVPEPLTPVSLTAAGPAGSILLAVDRREIIRLSADGSKLRKELVYTAKSPLIGIVKSENSYIAWTRQAIIIFDEKMVRQQVVPVLGTGMIRSFGATATRHAVGFSDGRIEVMDLLSHKKWATTKNEYSSQYIDFTGDESLVILSSDTELPRVFSVTNIR
jgi:hypothetical protein